MIEALAPMLAADSNLAELLCGLAEARRWDCLSEPFEDRAHFDAYLDATAGNLMWGAACALGAPQGAEAVVRDLAWGAGLAQWLRAAPELEARGRLPLVDGRPEAIGALAAEGRARIARGRRVRTIVPAPARPALWSAAGADAVLRRAAARATLVAAGGLAPSNSRAVEGCSGWRSPGVSDRSGFAVAGRTRTSGGSAPDSRRRALRPSAAAPAR